MDRLFYRWGEIRNHWSLWLASTGTAFVSWFVASPETAIAAWNMLPADLKASLPHNVTAQIGIGLLILSVLAKFVNQQRLKRKAAQAVKAP